LPHASRAERAATRAESPAKPPDAAAQARRAAQREARVADGVEELRRWLGDLVRRGLAGGGTDINQALAYCEQLITGLATQSSCSSAT
jgi:hypothetical protein